MSLDLDHHLSPIESADSTALLAAWMERRIDETTEWSLAEARLYGLTVRDRDRLADDAPDAARFCLLDRGYPYDVVEGPATVLAANFDAVALLTLGWQAPMGPDGQPFVRPSRHPDRVRVRIVSVVLIDPVVDAASLATALRIQGASRPSVVVDGGGAMVEAMLGLAAEALATRLVA